MHIELHDNDGRVEISDLTLDGIHNAIFLAEQLIEELREAADKQAE